MKCKCGKENVSTARYCAGCGLLLKSETDQTRTRIITPNKNLTKPLFTRQVLPQTQTQVLSSQRTKTIINPVTQRGSLVGQSQTDIDTLMDTTGSMEWAINGCKEQVHAFAGELAKYGLDCRLGLIEFRDLTVGENINVFEFTNSVEKFQTALGGLRAEGGGPVEESSLDALRESAKRNWRKQAVRIVLLFTDAPPWEPDQEGNTAQQIIDLLIKNSIMVYTIAPALPIYENISACTGGMLFPISPDPKEFRSILNTLGKTVSKTAYLLSRKNRETKGG